MKVLNPMNKIKGKINLVEMVMHRMMPKIKFMPPSLLMIKSKLKVKSKLKTVLKIKSKLKIKNKIKTTLRMIKLPLLNSLLRRNWSVMPLRLHPSSQPKIIS